MTTQKEDRQESAEDELKTTMLYIGADHAGFQAKEKIKQFLSKKDFACTDLGATTFDKNDDYPLYAHPVAKAVIQKKGSRGILICGSGQGMCIAANKIKGARAVQAWNTESARASRNDDNANILCLSARFLNSKQLELIITVWLETPFSGLSRHRRRINKLETT